MTACRLIYTLYNILYTNKQGENSITNLNNNVMKKKFTFLLIALLACLGVKASPPQQDDGNVAIIGSTEYETLQAAVDAAYTMTGDVTIELLQDIVAPYTLILQKAGLNLTVDGKDKKITGSIIVDGVGKLDNSETLIIQNVNFEGNQSNFYSGDDAFVYIANPKDKGKPWSYTATTNVDHYNYAHNVTVTNCSFKSTSDNFNVVGVKVPSQGARNININQCKGENLHSLAQLVSTEGGSVTNCVVNESESFVNVNGGEGSFDISGNTFTSAENADGYGVRENGNSTAVITLVDNSFTAKNAVVMGKGSSATAGTINVVSGTYIGDITKTDAATGSIVISGGHFSADPANYSAYVSEGVAVADLYPGEEASNGVLPGIIRVTQPGGTELFYSTLSDAVAAAEAGATIDIFKADTYTLPNISKNVTIEGTVDGVVFNHTSAGNVASVPNGATFKNVTFFLKYEKGLNYHGFQEAGTINMEECTIKGMLFSYGEMNFTNCEFIQEATGGEYNMWTYGPYDVRYTECTFTNTVTGKFLNVYREGTANSKVYIDKCKFINQGSVSKAAVNVKATSGSTLLSYDVYITESTTEGAFPAENLDPSATCVVLNSVVQVDDRTADGIDNITVTQDGLEIYPLKGYVAQIGDTKYTTLTEAFAAAENGQTVTLLVDYDATGETMYDTYRNLGIDEGITFDGDGHTLTVKGRGIAVGANASHDIAVTFKNITILNSSAGARCIDTRGNIQSLVLENVTLNTEGATGVMQPLTIGGNQSNIADIKINNSTIQTNDEGSGYYAIITFNPVGMMITNSTVKGWACIYAKGADNSAGSENSGFTLRNSTFVSKNIHSGSSNSFAAIMIMDKDVEVDAANTTFDIINTGDQTQALVGYPAESDFTGYVHFDEGNKIAFDNQGSGSCEFVFNQPASAEYRISGGVFTDEPDASLLKEGLVVVDNDDPLYLYTVAPGSYVAKIDNKKYTTLQKALDAAHEMTGDVTIELLEDITENTVVHQKADLNLTIEGKDGEDNHTITGNIAIDGDGRASGTETLTIQNIQFTGDKTNLFSGTTGFIIVPSTKTSGTSYYTGKYNYAHNITIDNCSFTSTSSALDLKAVETTSGAGCYNLVVKNVTATNLHSLSQLNGTTGGAYLNCTVDNSDSFVSITGGGGDFTIENCTFASSVDDGYAIRIKSSETTNLTLNNNNFTAYKAIQLGKAVDDTAGTINVESGQYVGEILRSNTTSNSGKIVISGGHFSAPLGNSKYAEFIAEGKSGVNGIYLTETPQAPNGLGDAVAVLTDAEGNSSNYASLEAAFADAIDGSSITLLKDCAGNGIKVPKGKFQVNGLEVDFGGYTYTVDGSTVGSAGTETQAFQLLKDNYIIFSNGTITSEKALFLVQNYSDLTLEDMTLTLNNENYASGYTLSNNNGNITIIGSTINANTGGGFAFDVCRYSSYPSVTVTVDGGSYINGDVEVSASGNDAKEGFTLMLADGVINGNLVIDESAKAAMIATPKMAIVRERDSFGQPAPEGFKWQSEGNGNSILVPANYVAQVGDKKYETFPEAATAAAGTKVITLLANIPDSYELTSGTLRVEKGAYDVTITAPEGYELVYTISGAVSIYSLTTVADMAKIEEGYYYIKNNGNDKYVNVKGRRTATIDADKNAGAGTIIKVKTNQNGQVQVLRSQAVDIPYYAQRAMTYVPEFVDLLVQKFGAEGSGQILGTQGVDAIMDKFNESFDYHLYVEKAGEGYRIYGRTPSMKPVIEFYQENKANVDAKLPQIETFVNDAIAKVVNKAGMGSSLLNSFKLETIWEQMGGTLTKPTDEASKLQFLQEVLANETNVWNFAYKTVTYYLEQVKDKIQDKIAETELAGQLPADLSSYFDLVEKIRPGFKYYIVQKDGKFDIVSQGNTDINANAARTIWTLEKAQTMAVNVPEDNSRIVGATFDESGKRTGFEKGYYTTLYTDFAYQLPEGAVALKVTEIKDAVLGNEPLTYESGDATLTLGLLVTEEIGQEVPAQTPVLIMSKSAGDINITIGDNFGASADVSKNILRGADYLINEYEINTPMLESLYSIASEKVSGLDKYEHLLRRNAGTVNNKYFFSLDIEEDLASAYKKKTGYKMQFSPVLTLSKQEGKKLAFNESWDKLSANSVFLFSEETKPVLFTLTGDVTRDGIIDASDVTGQTNIIQSRDKEEYNYDYEAADVIYYEGTDIDASDVTGEVNIIQKRTEHPDIP